MSNNIVTRPGGAGAPLDESYLVLSSSSALTNERVLSGGVGLNINDQGAGSPAVLNLSLSGSNGIAVTTGSTDEVVIAATAELIDLPRRIVMLGIGI